tara:strand:- start:13767 stop:15143 length:1377 start_codon:yes stop_codon:yes gene_type:complete
MKIIREKKYINNFTLSSSASLIEFYQAQENYKFKSFIITDKDNKLLGTLSDGDLRRYIANNGVPPKTIIDAMNTSPSFVIDNTNLSNEIIKYDITNGPLPIVDKNKTIVAVFNGENYIIGKQNLIHKQITVLAPTRITFGGGGTDLSLWFSKNEGLVVNVAIQKFARVDLKIRHDNKFHIHSLNTGENYLFSKEELIEYENNVITACIKRFNKLPGLDISINCDFEPGTGLGGSSSLVVALVKGLAHISEINLTDKELVKLAFDIERNDYGITGGWQDHICSSYGGLLITRFKENNFKVIKTELSRKDEDFLNSTLFLFPTGIKRHSTTIHDDIKKHHQETSFEECMAKIFSVAKEAEDIVIGATFHNLGPLLHKGWEEKKKMNKNISNNKIDNLYKNLLSLGATGGKLLGAGGGGYLLMFVPLEKQADFVEQCIDEKKEFERIKIDHDGSRVIGEYL